MALPSSRHDARTSEDVVQLAEAIARYDLFAGLDEEKIPDLVPALSVKTFQDEEIECRCPTASHDAFLVLDGKVAITQAIGDVQHVLELAGFGVVFNAGGLVGLDSIGKGALALGKVKLIAIDTRKLGELADRDCEVGYTVVRNLTRLLVAQWDRQLDHLLAAPSLP